MLSRNLFLPFQPCQYQCKPLKQVDIIGFRDLNHLCKNSEYSRTKSQYNLEKILGIKFLSDTDELFDKRLKSYQYCNK